MKVLQTMSYEPMTGLEPPLSMPSVCLSVCLSDPLSVPRFVRLPLSRCLLCVRQQDEKNTRPSSWRLERSLQRERENEGKMKREAEEEEMAGGKAGRETDIEGEGERETRRGRTVAVWSEIWQP